MYYFHLPHLVFSKLKLAKAYCHVVIVIMIIPPNPWVRSLVFYIELSGFSFFWMEKYAGKTVING